MPSLNFLILTPSPCTLTRMGLYFKSLSPTAYVTIPFHPLYLSPKYIARACSRNSKLSLNFQALHSYQIHYFPIYWSMVSFSINIYKIHYSCFMTLKYSGFQHGLGPFHRVCEGPNMCMWKDRFSSCASYIATYLVEMLFAVWEFCSLLISHTSKRLTEMYSDVSYLSPWQYHFHENGIYSNI